RLRFAPLGMTECAPLGMTRTLRSNGQRMLCPQLHQFSLRICLMISSCSNSVLGPLQDFGQDHGLFQASLAFQCSLQGMDLFHAALLPLGQIGFALLGLTCMALEMNGLAAVLFFIKQLVLVVPHRTALVMRPLVFLHQGLLIVVAAGILLEGGSLQ